MSNKKNMFKLLINRVIKKTNDISTNDISTNDISTNDISNNKYIISKSFNIIPLNIFQTYHALELPINIKENIELFIEINLITLI